MHVFRESKEILFLAAFKRQPKKVSFLWKSSTVQFIQVQSPSLIKFLEET